MDFKIGDEIEGYGETEPKKKRSSFFSILVVIIVSLSVGFIVYFVCNAIFVKKPPEPEPITRENLNLSEENVKILYNYVTYGTKGERNSKFLVEKNVTIDSFSNQEKYYYALQFVQQGDFENTGRTDTAGNKIYKLYSETIREYMQRFFGGSVSYTNDITMTYAFRFKMDGKNVGEITASADGDGLDVAFNGLEGASPNPVKPYYGELVAAYKEPDGTYTLEEKVVYAEAKEEQGVYSIYIYGDPEKFNLIETKLNQTPETLQQNPISISQYLDRATTVTYHFAIFNSMLYFESSKITNN